MGITIKRKETQKQLLAKTGASKKLFIEKTKVVEACSSAANVNDLTPKLLIDLVSIDQLKPAKRRVRKPGPQHVANVIKSIQTVGQVAPILIDSDGTVVDGHVVLEALKTLGLSHANVICLKHLNADQLELVKISLNKLAEGSVWELDELRLELEHLDDIGFDLSATGFSLPELDIILQVSPVDEAPCETDEAADDAAAPVSEIGDLWILGRHRLLCEIP